MRFSLLGLLFLCSGLLQACSNMDDPPELINKLRPILVTTQNKEASEPVIAGENFRLYFHLLAPTGLENAPDIVLTQPKLTSSPNLLSEKNLVNYEATVINKKNGLSHIIAGIEFKIDSDDIVGIETGKARVFYSVNIIEGERVVPIEGNILVYKDDQQEGFERGFSTSAITKPTADESQLSQKEIEIKAETGNEHNEPVKIAWFINEGSLQNRRASNSLWEVEQSGPLTLVFTIRGKESTLSAIRFAELTKP